MEHANTEQFMGPRLRALPNDRKRRFAVLMAGGELNQTEAAREAGYSDQSGAAKVQACLMMQDPDVKAAIEECTRGQMDALAPKAIACAKAILDDPGHKKHAFMTVAVLDRTGFFAKTEHKVTVEHTVDLKELEALARRLALEGGIPVERLIGVNGLGGKVIEHQPASGVSRETLTETDK